MRRGRLGNHDTMGAQSARLAAAALTLCPRHPLTRYGPVGVWALNPKTFEQCFTAWVGTLCHALEGKHIVIDGKSMRRSRKYAVGRGCQPDTRPRRRTQSGVHSITLNLARWATVYGGKRINLKNVRNLAAWDISFRNHVLGLV